MSHAHLGAGEASATERWLEATWPFVQSELPDQPVDVLEIGCGPYGGFVPRLLRQGHNALGIDPDAPQGQRYHRTEFERHPSLTQVDAVVASTSLHHVADLSQVLDAVTTVLKPQGILVVVEWALERFDESTAKWCFDRLATLEPGDEPGWLQRHRDQWAASGQSWDAYFQAWMQAAGLHSSEEVMRELDQRFDRRVRREGPYFFPDLAGTTSADEQAAIDASKIRATCIHFAGRRR
jgi:SAM-dependent methyltransferase